MRPFIASLLLTVCIASLSAAEESGTLKGRFIFDGKPPEAKRLKVDQDRRVCRDDLVDESLVVDANTRGIANIVVQLYLPRDIKAPVHPRLDEFRAASKELRVTQGRFEPHVFTVLTEQEFVLANDDSVGHNLAISVIANPAWCDLLPAGQQVRKRFKSVEKLPVSLRCTSHSWVNSYVVITDHPYVAVSDTKGNFAIPDLPPGKWTFRVWQERSGFIETVKRDDKDIRWEKGRVELDIRPGENDLGDILVAPEEFPEK